MILIPKYSALHHKCEIKNRRPVCLDAAWLGVELDPQANIAGGPRISASGSDVTVWAIPTNEELMIARHTLNLVTGN